MDQYARKNKIKRAMFEWTNWSMTRHRPCRWTVAKTLPPYTNGQQSVAISQAISKICYEPQKCNPKAWSCSSPHPGHNHAPFDSQFFLQEKYPKRTTKP